MLNFAARMVQVHRYIIAILACLLTSSWALAGDDGHFRLVIDAGHGGNDAGAMGKYSKEKDINLKVALAFGRLVQQNCPDVKVIYTRKTDVFIPLYRRADIANENKADLFMSVHTNALPGGKIARGFETHTLGDGRSQATKTNLEVAKRENSVIFLEKDYQRHYVGFDPNSPESNIMFEFVQDNNLAKSIDLAKMLQKHVCQTANRPDKGVHQNNLAVLRLTSMPACLLELGFITTADEERLLNNEEDLERISRGIYNAFAEYKNKYDKGFVVPYKTEADEQKNNRRQEPEVEPEPQPSQKTEEASESRHQEETTEREEKPSRQRTRAAQAVADHADAPVFKVQIIAGSQKLQPGSAHFKGLKGCESYTENGMTKYTYGASTNYNEIYNLRKQILDKFPQAFIIAFKNGQRTDINEAIREYKRNKNK